MSTESRLIDKQVMELISISALLKFDVIEELRLDDLYTMI
jgi:hypothetical protein